jgi:hypothetical protein
MKAVMMTITGNRTLGTNIDSPASRSSCLLLRNLLLRHGKTLVGELELMLDRLDGNDLLRVTAVRNLQG